MQDKLWITDGWVNSVITNGNTIYIGGIFSQMGPATGGFVAIDTSKGIYDPQFPKVAGDIYAVVSDGAGGWYIGGLFTHIGGVARNNIAHIQYNKGVY